MKLQQHQSPNSILSEDYDFHSSEKQSTSSVDLKKKRKLHYESGSLHQDQAKQKQQCRGVVAIFRETQEDLEEQKSENGSNSFMDTYDNSMSSDAKDKLEPSTIHQDQPSPSLNSSSNEVNHVAGAVSEDTLPFDTRLKIAEDLYPTGFGLDHAISELGSEGDAETENMILYSNDVPPHSFVLSSGRWNLGQGGPMGAKRPTIDQEFEQYFSSLML